MSDYERYRGKCKEMSEELIKKDPTLRLVKGWYWDALWGQQGHWWCVDKDGKIIDPSKDQFPTKGNGHYEEFDGYYHCDQCGEQVHESKAYIQGRVFCSEKCFRNCVGI